MIKCSAGTAKVLGLKELRTEALPTTAYLMTGERCNSDCSFCPQAKSATSRSDLLSRVTWPKYEKNRVIPGVAEAYSRKELKRACLQVVNSSQGLEESKRFLQDIGSISKIPVCVSCSVTNLAGVAELFDLGADHVSIALDAACERVFGLSKGGSWLQKRSLLAEAARAFPGRIATHLIVGLGESEEEMLQTIQEMVDLGVTVALFAFTPVKGTKLGSSLPPSICQYRRVQAARFLMVKGLIRFGRLYFEQGKLINLGIGKEFWPELFGDGEAFRTSGCPDCNRPFYNEKPGGLIYNYPRQLDDAQKKLVMEQLLACFGELV